MNATTPSCLPHMASTEAVSPRILLAIRLSGWPQGLLTFLIGQPLPGEVLPRRSAAGRTAQGFALFALGIGGGVAAASVASWGWLPLAWGAALAGARDLQLNVMHQASHYNVISKRFSEWAGRIASTVLLETAFPEYVIKHRQHHKHRLTSTGADDTVVFLRRYLCIEPGLPVAENRRRFLKHLLSPDVWLQMLKNRLRSQLCGDGQSRLACLAYLGSVGVYTSATGQWLGVLLGWAFPLFVLYPIAKSARAVVEHRWPDAEKAACPRSAEEHTALSFSVRCAVLPPATWTPGTSLNWVAAMVFNALVRVCVLPGESGPGHAWHHAVPKGDWANAISAAAEWEASRTAQGLPPTDEAWGYLAALEMALASFAAASPASLETPEPAKVQS